MARALAVLAMTAALAAVVLVINSSTGGDGEEEGAGASDSNLIDDCNPKAGAAVEAGFYIVKPGEHLSLIAERACAEVEDLETLNPDLDPQALAPGACVNLSEGGCASREE